MVHLSFTPPTSTGPCHLSHSPPSSSELVSPMALVSPLARKRRRRRRRRKNEKGEEEEEVADENRLPTSFCAKVTGARCRSLPRCRPPRPAVTPRAAAGRRWSCSMARTPTTGRIRLGWALRPR